MNTYLRSFFLAVFSLSGIAAAAKAQTVITSLPYTITSSGTYVLNSNLNSTQTSGKLIAVNASNVTIDFQNHYIAGPVGNTGQSTIGIDAYEQSNVTIKNGTIAYCNEGIVIEGNGTATTNSVGHQIDNMRVTYCYQTSIYMINGSASRVTNCQVSQGGYSGADTAYGILVTGAGTTIQGNLVNSITATNTFGISLAAGSYARQNTISGAIYGVYGGKYQDNLTSGCTFPYAGGSDAGGNS